MGYGAGYYSYLYARVFAADIWEKCFAKDPLDASAGNKLYKEMMIHGGAKDPITMISNVLGAEPSMESYLKEIGVGDRK